MIPRIRGRVGQAESEDPKYNGKWYFTVWITPIGQGKVKDEDSLGEFGPWETEEIAKKELEKCTKLICEKIERRENGAFSGKYIDMKDNITKKFSDLEGVKI